MLTAAEKPEKEGGEFAPLLKPSNVDMAIAGVIRPF